MKNIKIKFLNLKIPQAIMIILIVAILLLSACSSNTTGRIVQDDVIKIGFIGPLTGDVSAYGDGERKGIDLAVEQLNLEGHNIEVIYEDDQCDPKLATLAINKLIYTDDVDVIIGPTCSSAMLAIAPIAEENEVILISPTAGSDEISDAGDFIFRVFMANHYYADKGIEILSEYYGVKKVAVLYIENDFGVNVKDTFTAGFDDVLSLGYSPSEKDFKSILLKVKDYNPDMIYLAGYHPDGALILSQAKELGIQIPFFGSGEVYELDEFLKLSGSASEGFVFPSGATRSGPTQNDFAKKYRAKYNEKPMLYSDFSYDIVNILFEAIDNVGEDPVKIKDYLYDLKDYPGASNNINFDKNGDLEKPSMALRTVEDGKFKTLEVFN